MPKKRAPDGLGAKAKRVWKDITGEFDLRADELRLLEDACREIDTIERVEAALAVGDLIAKGSQGQPVASPLLQEIRQHRAVLKSLFGALKLPEEEATQDSRTVSARSAANVRWRIGT